MFESYRYSKANSNELASLYQNQAYNKFNNGDYVLGKVDDFGQRIIIEIDIPGIGSSTGKSGIFKSGWIINSDGTIRIVTPFAG